CGTDAPDDGETLAGRDGSSRPAGFKRTGGLGGVFCGYDGVESQRAFSGGLGLVARRHAHAHESCHAHSPGRIESPDGTAGGVSAADQSALHRNDAQPPQSREPEGTQTDFARDEKTGQGGGASCPQASGSAGSGMEENRLDAAPSRAGPGAHRPSVGAFAAGAETGARANYWRTEG